MDIEKAIETLKKMKWGAYERGVTGDALDMAIRSLQAWKELKNEREEWIKSDCKPYTPDVVKAYLKDIEVGYEKM